MRRSITTLVGMGIVLSVVVGYASGAVRYSVTNFGSLEGGNTHASAINDLGQVVGSSAVDVGFGVEYNHAFLWSVEEGMKDITPVGYSYATTAQSINNSGIITGGSDGSLIVWDSLGMHNVGPGGGSGINSAGTVAGSANNHAFTWDSTNAYNYLPFPVSSFSESRAVCNK